MKNKLNILVFFLFVLSAFFLFGAKNSKKVSSQKPLSKSHFHLKGGNNCTKCHTRPGEADSNKCLSCHREIKSRIDQGRGYHKDKNEDCAGCHSEHSGQDADLTDLDEKDFDHSETGYLLSGKHKSISTCRKCHSPSRVFPRKKTLSYLLNDNKCKSCHEPPHPLIKENCGKCHLTNSWEIDQWNF